MLKRKYSIFITLFIGVGWGLSFQYPDPSYIFPLERFRALSGTFGELRGAHFHGGLDLKTGGRSGAPILAIADGFVYRIVVSPVGYGNALYIKHSDGKFSVYGHLSTFNEEISRYVRTMQYKTQKFPQNIYLEEGEMYVDQGEEIGKSGNTGSSFGPHLHFEIRDSLERPLNPLHYLAKEIEDHIPPIVRKIGFEPLSHTSRINGEYRKATYVPVGRNGTYTILPIIKLRGRVGLEYLAHDLLDAARNRCGINTAKLFVDSTLIFEFHLDRFSFDQTHFIEQHIDYGHYLQHNEKFQKAYLDVGNQLDAYPYTWKNGYIELFDDTLHSFRLELYDTYVNKTEVRGRLQRDTLPDQISDRLTFSAQPRWDYEIHRNNLVLTASRPTRAFLDGITYQTPSGQLRNWLPTYSSQNRLVFILPLGTHDYPVKLIEEEHALEHPFSFREEITPSQNHFVTYEGLHMYFPYQSVYDCLALEIEKDTLERLPPYKKTTNNTDKPVLASARYRIGNPLVPLAKSIWIGFNLPDSLPPHKLGIGQWDARKATWNYQGGRKGQNHNIYTRSREFGTYAILLDTIPPIVKPLNFIQNGTVSPTQRNLSLKAEDTFSGIQATEINCLLDGEWVLVNYDPRYNALTYRLENRPSPGKHVFHVEVSDRLGNAFTHSYTLTF